MSVISVLTALLPFVAVVVFVVTLVRKTRSAPPKGIAGYDLTNGTGVRYAQVRAPGIHLSTPSSITILQCWGAH